MDLRQNLVISIACAFGAAFVLVSLLLLSGWAALLVVASVLSSLIQLVGVMILLDIKLSAIPAVILVLSVGLGVCFTVHISLVSCCRELPPFKRFLCNETLFFPPPSLRPL